MLVPFRVVSGPSHSYSDKIRCSAVSGTSLEVNLRGVLFSVRPGAEQFELYVAEKTAILFFEIPVIGTQ